MSRLGVTRFAERIAQPFQPFVETVTGGGASGLDVLCVGIRICGRNLASREMDLPRRAVAESASRVCQ